VYSFADLAESSRQQLEADCFWCFSKLLDGIQDNYTFAQPGIQQRISSLKELVSRIDGELWTFLVIFACLFLRLQRYFMIVHELYSFAPVVDIVILLSKVSKVVK